MVGATWTYRSNRRHLQSAVGDKIDRVLRRSGAFGRGAMIRMFRRANGISQPGKPPHAHASGRSGLRAVEFAVSSRKVVVGPVLYIRSASVKPMGKTVPQLLNEGGKATIVAPGESTQRVVQYRARPFVAPTQRLMIPFIRRMLREERL